MLKYICISSANACKAAKDFFIFLGFYFIKLTSGTCHTWSLFSIYWAKRSVCDVYFLYWSKIVFCVHLQVRVFQTWYLVHRKICGELLLLVLFSVCCAWESTRKEIKITIHYANITIISSLTDFIWWFS